MSLKNNSKQLGTEILKKATGGSSSLEDNSHHAKVISESGSINITGKYMSVTLTRLFVDMTLQSKNTEEIRTFTILGAIWHNLWGHRIKTLLTGSIKMIDSEGFQHSGDLCEFYKYRRIVLPNSQGIIDIDFAWPELTLEAHAKSKGYVWFDNLPNGVMPHRFIFKFEIFEPGQISGGVKDGETFEFVLANW